MNNDTKYEAEGVLMDNKIIVDSIKELCKKNNITMTSLEEKLGLSQGLISRWGKTTPSLDKIMDIADYFKVSLDEVTGYNNIESMFISVLYNKTKDKTFKWYKTDTLNEYFLEDFFDEDNYEYTAYCSSFGEGEVIISAFHEHFCSHKPIRLHLYIKPSKDSNLIIEEYSSEELAIVWATILNTLGNEAPDEVKAQMFKLSLIKEHGST